MTVSTTTNRISYACDGAAVDFAYTFPIFEDSDLTVILRDSSGSETTLTLTTDYTVSGAGVSTGGNVTTVATYASGNTIVIIRDLDITQETDYPTAGAFPASSHEDALDKLTMIAQQLSEALDRCIKLAVSSSYTNVELPDPNDGKFLGWASGILTNAEPVDIGNLTAHNGATLPHQSGGWLASNTVTGPVLLATSAETAAGNDASAVVTPLALASVLGYDTAFIPAGAMINTTTNGATVSTREYPINGENIDYMEFGSDADEIAVNVWVTLPETWDQATIKAKAVWASGYDKALTLATIARWGYQGLAVDDGSDIDTNWATPPVYVDDAVTNEASRTVHTTDASGNFATAIAGSDNLIGLRITRSNSVANSATAPVYLFGVILQWKNTNQVSGW